jgi:hypothetical protein
MNYLLIIVARHCLGYETVLKSNINVPDTCANEELSGSALFRGFMKH